MPAMDAVKRTAGDHRTGESGEIIKGVINLHLCESSSQMSERPGVFVPKSEILLAMSSSVSAFLS